MTNFEKSQTDEKIVKIQANKRLPEANKTQIVAKLTALKIEILK